MIKIFCPIGEVRPHFVRKSFIALFFPFAVVIGLIAVFPFEVANFARDMWDDCFAKEWEGK